VTLSSFMWNMTRARRHVDSYEEFSRTRGPAQRRLSHFYWAYSPRFRRWYSLNNIGILIGILIPFELTHSSVPTTTPHTNSNQLNKSSTVSDRIMSSSQASQTSNRGTPPGTPNRQIMSSPRSDQEDEIILSRGESSSIANLVIKAASLCNRVIVEKCGMCTVYCDEQIRHELLAAQTTTSLSPSMWMPTSLMDEMEDNIQAARHYLFDEESVVDSITDRC